MYFAALLAVIPTTPAPPPSFSATIVHVEKDEPERRESKLFVKGSRLRIDHDTKTVLFRRVGVTFTLLDRDKKVYVQASESILDDATRALAKADVTNACAQLIAIEKERGRQATCEHASDATVLGRKVTQFRGHTAQGQNSTLSIDPALHFFIALQTVDVQIELHDIAEAPQPVMLFTIPDGFKSVPLQ